MESIITNYKILPSQRELAKRLNVTDAYICMLLSGKRKNAKMLKKLKNILTQYNYAA